MGLVLLDFRLVPQTAAAATNTQTVCPLIKDDLSGQTLKTPHLLLTTRDIGTAGQTAVRPSTSRYIGTRSRLRCGREDLIFSGCIFSPANDYRGACASLTRDVAFEPAHGGRQPKEFAP